MIFKNLAQFNFDENFTTLLIGEDKREISLTEQCEFFGSDYAVYDDQTTRAELNWLIFSDNSKTKAVEALSMFFHDVQSFAIKNGKGTAADEDKELDCVVFKKEWEELEFHFKQGKIIKVSASEIETVISPLRPE